MIKVDDGVLKLAGPVTIETHTKWREHGASHIGKSDWIVDWADVTEVDSSALSLMFAWRRDSRAAGKTISNLHLPQNLKALAELYGVADFVSATQ